MTTTPEAVEAAKEFACKLHDGLTERTLSRKKLYPYTEAGEGTYQACIRILAARVGELELKISNAKLCHASDGDRGVQKGQSNEN